MIVLCPQCSVSLQIDESKATTKRFTIRCPKCQHMIPVDTAGKSNPNETAVAPTPPAARNWDTTPAATFQKSGQVSSSSDEIDSTGNPDLLRLLAATLKKASGKSEGAESQSQKRILMCLNPERNRSTAERMADAGYKIFLADNPAQATEKIRDGEIDIVIFSVDFAPKANGSSVLQQVINSLATSERRALFVIAIEDNSQTFNTHEAFLRNLNLIVNSSDLHHLPSILHRALHDYNDLYRTFNKSLKVSIS